MANGFEDLSRLRVLPLPPGWDASPSQGYPPPLLALCQRYPFIHLRGERERDNMEQSFLFKETTQWQRPGNVQVKSLMR